MKSQFELAAAARPLFEPDIFTTCAETDSPLSRKTHPLRVWYNDLRSPPPSLRYASTPPWPVEPPAVESCPPSIAHTSISTKTGAIASTTCVCPAGLVVSSAKIRSSPFPGRNASKRNEITSRQSNKKSRQSSKQRISRTKPCLRISPPFSGGVGGGFEDYWILRLARTSTHPKQVLRSTLALIGEPRTNTKSHEIKSICAYLSSPLLERSTTARVV